MKNKLDMNALEITLKEDQSMSVDVIPVLHNLPPKAQIDFVCTAFDLKEDDFNFSFDKDGYMSISAKDSVEYIETAINITSEES